MQVIQYNEGMQLPECGFVVGMPNETYHSIKSHVSCSMLKRMKQSPFHFFNPAPFEQSRPKEIGSAIHSKVLEPESFSSEYIMMPELKDRQRPEYKSACKVFGAEVASNLGLKLDDKEIYSLGSKYVFAGKECHDIDAMFNAIYGNDDAAELLNSDGWCELSGFATCPRTGLKLKIRFDKRLKDGRAIDLKKTQSVHDRDLSNSITSYGYHIQEAFYTYVDSLICGKELESFEFIFAEEKYPNEVKVGPLDDISRAIGKQEMNKLLDLVVHYSNNQHKPTNNNPRTIFSVAEWKLREFEDEIF